MSLPHPDYPDSNTQSINEQTTKMDNALTNPHDHFFRKMWSDRDLALDFLQNYLPASVMAVADLGTLEIQKDSFVEKRLRDYFSDILYRVALAGEPGYVYLLFEHKSHPERWIHLQQLEYMPQIWRLFLKQEKGRNRRLPIIVPMVFYHGGEKWSGKRRFAELFAGPVEKLSPYLPDFESILFDFSPFSDQEIRGRVLLRATLMLMKHVFDPDVHDKLPKILKLILDVSETRSGLRAVETMLRYLFNEVPDLTVEKAKNMAEQHCGKEKKEVVMTVAEQLRKEGIDIGERRGARKTLVESLEMGLNLRFGPKGLTYMPRINRMRKIERLKSLQQALYTAQDISEFERAMETGRR
jgi:predicted transposase/invertase (TIGR01784 family)